MLKYLVKKLMAPRHSWRDDALEFQQLINKLGSGHARVENLYGGFDELSELYISILFRSLALSVTGIFVPVFLLRYGYTVPDIFMFFVLFFLTRTFMDVLGGYLVAKYGPKHTMVVSYLSQVAASLFFMTLPNLHWPLLLPAVTWAAANSLFFIAFHVHFSKIKHSEHGGKELGFINIMERVGAMLGPLIGGLLAFLFNPQYIFVGAIALLILGLVPLFQSKEPTRQNQHLDFRNFHIDSIKRDYISYVAFAAENNLSLTLWPLYLALFALGTNVFISLGALGSISIGLSAVVSYYVGKKVDEKKGASLLKFATTLNALVQVLRPFVYNLPTALASSVARDVVAVGYNIPYHKAMYDAADEHPGYRIVYLVSMEAFSSFVKFVIWMLLFILSGALATKSLFIIGFAIASAASLGILTQRFKALEYANSNG